MTMRLSKLIVIGLAALVVAGCETSIPKEALQLTPDTLARRQVQTRIFETTNEIDLLTASTHLLQDLGFYIDESEVELGVVVASKERDATEADQVVGSILLAIFLGVAVPWDDEQKIHASIITRELKERNGYAVRLTMQRIVWNTANEISKTEPLDDPEMYQEFFAKLSKAVFLEAHEL